MTTMAEIDTFYIKSICALHSKDHLQGKPTLQTLLEEAIKAKTGQEKSLTTLVQTLMKQSGVETLKATLEEAKTASSSDNELELDLLLKEDLACVICQGMDVGARNRLLECSDCHALYHQECHQPTVTQQEADNAWVCANCKEVKRVKKSPTHSSSSSSSHTSSKPKSTSNSPRHSSERSSERSERGNERERSSGYKSQSSKSSSSGNKTSSSSGSKSSSSSKAGSSSSSSKHTPVTTSSNIISADKRIQNMKKKAASKLHEKKKLPRT